MGQRLVWLVGGVLLLALFLAACNGGNGTIVANPTTGADVCAGLEGAKRFRYVFDQALESPQPSGPIDESAVGDPPFALDPTFADFLFELRHDGSFVRPDSIDIEISVPDQASVRTILIGAKGDDVPPDSGPEARQWFNLGGTWSEESSPAPFPFLPTRVCRIALSAVDFAGLTATVETVDDTEARHFRAEGVAMETASDLFGAASDMGRLLKSYDVDVWLTEEGRLVKLESLSSAPYPSGRELTMRISLDVGPYDEDGIEIEAPI